MMRLRPAAGRRARRASRAGASAPGVRVGLPIGPQRLRKPPEAPPGVLHRGSYGWLGLMGRPAAGPKLGRFGAHQRRSPVWLLRSWTDRLCGTEPAVGPDLVPGSGQDHPAALGPEPIERGVAGSGRSPR